MNFQFQITLLVRKLKISKWNASIELFIVSKMLSLNIQINIFNNKFITNHIIMSYSHSFEWWNLLYSLKCEVMMVAK